MESKGDNKNVEGRKPGHESVKRKRVAEKPVNECRFSFVDWEAAMAEVLTCFARYKPPSRGYRPTLLEGAHFGKEQLPKVMSARKKRKRIRKSRTRAGSRGLTIKG